MNKTIKILDSIQGINVAVLNRMTHDLNLRAAVSFRRRMGENGAKNLSKYNSTDWDNWDRHQRKMFKENLPPKYVDRSVLGWFLALHAPDSFLDRIVYWKDNPEAAVVVAYALNGAQKIILDDVEYTLNNGQGIMFSLSNPHEILRSDNNQLWACLMIPTAAIDPAEWN